MARSSNFWLLTSNLTPTGWSSSSLSNNDPNGGKFQGVARAIRRWRTGLAAAVLASQVLSVGGTAAVFVSLSSQAASAVCHCIHGRGETCPMHRTAAGARMCLFRPAHAADASAIVNLLGPIGPPAVLSAFVDDADAFAADWPITSRVRTLRRGPEFPPPRA